MFFTRSVLGCFAVGRLLAMAPVKVKNTDQPLVRVAQAACYFACSYFFFSVFYFEGESRLKSLTFLFFPAALNL